MAAGRPPPGWPADLPPPATPEFRERVAGWLLDRCPPGYRSHGVLRRHPVTLAWLARRHVAAEAAAVDAAVAAARSELHDTAAAVVEEVVLALQAESAALLGERRAVDLVHRALSGTTFVPRL